VTTYTFDPKVAAAYTRRTFNMKGWLQGDIIVRAAATTSGLDTSLRVASVTINGNLITVWLSGGTAEVTYTILLEVQTGDGRDDFIAATIQVQ
jgi:hypothetical protein